MIAVDTAVDTAIKATFATKIHVHTLYCCTHKLFITVQNHSITVQNHSITVQNHSITVQNHSITVQNHSITVQNHSITVQNHSITVQNHTIAVQLVINAYLHHVCIPFEATFDPYARTEAIPQALVFTPRSLNSGHVHFKQK